jgi:hypothetical protein
VCNWLWKKMGETLLGGKLKCIQAFYCIISHQRDISPSSNHLHIYRCPYLLPCLCHNDLINLNTSYLF